MANKLRLLAVIVTIHNTPLPENKSREIHPNADKKLSDAADVERHAARHS
jgi:hypothetical protein